MMRWFTPRPDSLLGQMRSPLYMRWQAGVSLFALVVLFQGPLAAGHFSWHWMGPTLLALPLYLYLNLRDHGTSWPWSRSGWRCGATTRSASS